MQPLQYYLRDPAAKDNSITHAAGAPSNLDAATNYNAICRDWVAKHNRTTRKGIGNCSSKTGSRRQREKKTISKHFLKGLLKGKLLVPKLRKSADKSLSQHAFCSITWQTCMYLRTWQQSMTTIMQPFQCDLQPEIQETNRTTHTGTPNHTWNDRSRNRRTHEVPFIAGCSHSHFTQKNARFRDPASSPKQSPCNIHAAITIRFAVSRRKPASLYAHGNTRWQQSCSHPNAICNHRFKKRIELRTQEQPLVAEHRGGTNSRMKRPQPQPAHTRYLSSPAEATIHGKIEGFVLRLPPQNKAHATFMQPLQCVLQHHVANPNVSTHTATEHDNNHAAIPMRSATTDSRNA